MKKKPMLCRNDLQGKRPRKRRTIARTKKKPEEHRDFVSEISDIFRNKYLIPVLSRSSTFGSVFARLEKEKSARMESRRLAGWPVWAIVWSECGGHKGAN